MDGPIISIFDMLKKRYRQQKKEEQLQQETFPVDGKRPTYPTKTTEVKRLKSKSSRNKIAATPKEKSTKMTSNVVTAAHLTKKRSGMLMPAMTKKEVLDELIVRMTSPPKRFEEKLNISNESSSSVESSIKSVVSALQKPKPAIPAKPKIVKAMPGSASSQSRRRQALSPRNTNSVATPKLKRERPIKLKAIHKSDVNNNVTAERPKRRLQVSKSKSSFRSKLERKADTVFDENAVHYRL
ncbi:hypothetical protein KR044_007335 [Drosophila immigrans]|nr:hypothetical protein KR044_007335 [Drosophila immigrans]